KYVKSIFYEVVKRTEKTGRTDRPGGEGVSACRSNNKTPPKKNYKIHKKRLFYINCHKKIYKKSIKKGYML
ncbi:MAG TPA: hypothetical protein PKM10_09495, partial [Halanaerobiales bacterium]|nr:hypothetical protein [Halanaerobiales bacterium]